VKGFHDAAKKSGQDFGIEKKFLGSMAIEKKLSSIAL
jgi:hypothetical protein